MATSGTLGAALSTAIWAAIAGAVWASVTAALLRGPAWVRAGRWLANAAGWFVIVMVPQGLRLWAPSPLVHRLLPHTLTVPELALLVKIAAIGGIVGTAAATLYRHLLRRLGQRH